MDLRVVGWGDVNLIGLAPLVSASREEGALARQMSYIVF
jgi:hypothetical protein